MHRLDGCAVGMCVYAIFIVVHVTSSQKLSAARQEGSRRTVRKSDVIYTTEKATEEQVHGSTHAPPTIRPP
jgi:MFS superfamily sulfate permease-like transporter